MLEKLSLLCVVIVLFFPLWFRLVGVRVLYFIFAVHLVDGADASRRLSCGCNGLRSSRSSSRFPPPLIHGPVRPNRVTYQ